MTSRNTLYIVLSAFLFLVACGDDGGSGTGQPSNTPEAAAEIETVEVTVDDKAIDVPPTIEAEPTTLVAENVGKDPHQVYITRLNEGVTADDVAETLEKGDPAALEDMLMIAGSFPGEGQNFGRVSPGKTNELAIDYPVGNYLVIDPEVEGPPPMGAFEIVAATGPEVAEPESDYEVEAGDFYFKTAGPTSGPSTVKITNAGEQDHEVSASRMVDGDEEEGAFTFAPPPGGSLWTTFDLDAGTYQLKCYLPDDKTGKPHFKLGMQTDIEVE